MTDADVANVKNAALSVLDFYDPIQQWVGIVSLPYGQPAEQVLGVRDAAWRRGRHRPPTRSIRTRRVRTLAGMRRLEQELQERRGRYINPAARLVQEINCLVRAPDTVYATSQGGAPQREPHEPRRSAGCRSRDARRTGRPTVPDVIIFMTDGQANQPSTMSAVHVLQQQGDDRQGGGSGRSSRSATASTARSVRTHPRLVLQQVRDDEPGARGDAALG